MTSLQGFAAPLPLCAELAPNWQECACTRTVGPAAGLSHARNRREANWEQRSKLHTKQTEVYIRIRRLRFWWLSVSASCCLPHCNQWCSPACQDGLLSYPNNIILKLLKSLKNTVLFS